MMKTIFVCLLIGIIALGTGGCRDQSAGNSNITVPNSDLDSGSDTSQAEPDVHPGTDVSPPDLPVQCPAGTQDYNTCLPKEPQMEADVCPSGETSDEGLCLPSPPRPMEWSCPPGWVSTAVFESPEEFEQQSYCKPPPLPETCPPGFMQVVGEEACARIGAECPTDEQNWHDEPSIRARADGYDGRIFYVLAESNEGNGSREQPLHSIALALEEAEAGDIVVLGRGLYEEEFSLTVGVALVGSCVEQTIIAAPDLNEQRATVRVSSSGVLVSDLTVDGGGLRAGIGVGAPNVTLHSLHVRQGLSLGIQAAGSRGLTIADTLVSDTLSSTFGMSNGPCRSLGSQGLCVSSAEVQVARSVFDSNHTIGVIVLGGPAELEMTDVLISNTQPQQRDGMFGIGLLVARGSVARLQRTVFDSNRSVAVASFGVNSRLEATDIHVVNTLPQASDEKRGRGLEVSMGGFVDLTRATFDSNQDTAVFVSGKETMLVARDLLILNTLQPVVGEVGIGGDLARGLGIDGEASAHVERAVFESNQDMAIFVGGTNGETETTTQVVLEDIVVSNTIPSQRLLDSRVTLGAGAHVQGGAHAQIHRVVFSALYENAIIAHGEETLLTITDVQALNTKSRTSDGTGGRGLELSSGSNAEVSRARFDANQEIAILVVEGSRLIITDVMITGTLPRLSDDDGGIGLSVEDQGFTQLNRGVFRNNHDTAIFVRHEGTQLLMSSVFVANTQPRRSDNLFGRGLSVQTGAHVEVTQAIFKANHEHAITVFEDGTSAILNDVLVLDTLPRLAGNFFGRGLEVGLGAQAEVNRATFMSNREHGIAVFSPNTRVTLNDIVVLDTRPRLAGSIFGRGFEVARGAWAEVNRAVFDHNHDTGVMVYGQETQATFTDLHVYSTQLLPNDKGGTGLAVIDGRLLNLSRYTLSNNTLAGLQIAREHATIDKSNDGLIIDNFLGINIQTNGFSVSTLRPYKASGNCCGDPCDVNNCNISSRTLYIPESSDVAGVLEF